MSVGVERTRRLPRPVAVIVWALALGIPFGMGMLVIAAPLQGEEAWAFPLYLLIVGTWGLTGAFLVTRRPDNRVGWVLLAVGAGIGAALIGQLWALASAIAHDGTLPGTTAGAMLGLLFFPSFYLVMLVPLLFPDGKVMSRRWGAVAVLLLVSATMTFVGALVRPGELEGMPGFENPLGMPALGGLSQSMIDLAGIGALACTPAGIVAAIVRYRRGAPVERKQLKWFGSVLVFAFSMFFGAATLPQPYGQWAWIIASLSIGLIPLAIGIAVLRYRLYEIDRIVSRTLSYALVTGVLALVFIGTNLALQSVVSSALGGSTLTVAASTLVVAALFQPVRRRIQAPIDRRFNRARSDAERVVTGFAARVREDPDLGAVQGRLVVAAGGAVQPRGAAVWIRPGGGRR